MQLILVRHGETAWNVEEIFRGRANVPLNEVGRRQAALVARHLGAAPVEAVYSSPLSRSFHTAEAIAVAHGLTAVGSEGLNDLNFGEWEGQQVEEVRRVYPGQFRIWETDPGKALPPGGESLADARSRAMGAISDITKRHANSVVVVSHRAVIKLIALALLGLDESSFWHVKIDPCSMTVFDLSSERAVLLTLNDTCFLVPAGAKDLADF